MQTLRRWVVLIGLIYWAVYVGKRHIGALCLAATITQLHLRSWFNGLDADFAAVSCLSGLLRLSCLSGF